jgi:hypothetical protein
MPEPELVIRRADPEEAGILSGLPGRPPDWACCT